MNKSMISSLEIMAKTGLSRQTLNNYINWGILPKPEVRKPDDPSVRARQLGYFDPSVLETIAAVKNFKSHGIPMAEIRRRLVGETSQESLFPDTSSAVPLNAPEKTAKRIGPPRARQASLFGTDEDTEDETLDEESPVSSGFHEDDEAETATRTEAAKAEPHDFCVLAATLKDAPQVRAELLPAKYLDLWQKLWTAAEAAVRECDGRWLLREENTILAYFLNNDRNDAHGRAVACGLLFLKETEKLGSYLKNRNKYMSHVSVGIGIHNGFDYIDAMGQGNAVQVIDAGDTTTAAVKLSQYARGGTVWASKGFINRLPENVRRKIRFGVRSMGQPNGEFLDNRFLRIGDPPYNGTENGRRDFPEIDDLPVTEIVERSLR